MQKLSVKDLIDFESEIVEPYEKGKIRAPVHFSGGNEESLIRIFRDIKDSDWVFSTHRSHYHALLKGVDREWLKEEILSGRSISLNDKDHNFFTSAIVAGIIPIAVGVALGIKLKSLSNHVWVFIGDMAAETGIFHEAIKYSGRNDLPITFVIEDNEFSVNSPTRYCWGENSFKKGVIRYLYARKYPHQGSGKWVVF